MDIIGILSVPQIVTKLNILSQKYIEIFLLKKKVLSTPVPNHKLVLEYTNLVNTLDNLNNKFTIQLFDTYKVAELSKRIKILDTHIHLSVNESDRQLFTTKSVLARKFLPSQIYDKFIQDRNENDRAHINFLESQSKLSPREIDLADTNIQKLYIKMIELYNRVYNNNILKPIITKIDGRIETASLKKKKWWNNIKNQLIIAKSIKSHIPHGKLKPIKANKKQNNKQNNKPNTGLNNKQNNKLNNKSNTGLNNKPNTGLNNKSNTGLNNKPNMNKTLDDISNDYVNVNNINVNFNNSKIDKK
jgi:hypothetical protein